MKRDDKKITICMGSSCYARGNVYNVEILQSWLQKRGLDASVELTGSLCRDLCREGPIITIGDAVYKAVSPSSVEEILAHEFPEA